MSVPRIVVNETLEIKRIAVTAEGQDITVTIAEAAAGVSTVNGQSDVVVLTTDDITEGVDNLYYTNARADARVAAGVAAIDFPVDSVNGATGAVVLTTSAIGEGTNLYYTQARADARVAAGIAAIDYPVDSVNGQTNTVVLDSDDVAEGTTNLYYTDARADARVAAGIANLVDSAPTTLDTLNELAAALGDDPNFATTVTAALGNKLNTADFTSTADTWLGTKSTSNLSEGTNLYYTDGRFDTRLATKTTTDLGEGTRLYYTDARARSAVSVTDTGGDGALSYDPGTGVITYTGPSATEVRAHLSGGTGVTYTAGTGVIAIGQDVATTASPSFVGGTFTGNITTAGAATNRFVRTAAGTGNTIPLVLNRNRTDGARATANGPWLAFEYQGTDNTLATSPQNAFRSQYDAGGRHYLELLELAGSYTTGVAPIARFKRGDYFFRNSTGSNAFQLDDDNCSITGQVATAGFQNLLFLTKRRTDVAAPTDGDYADFRIGFQGNTGLAITTGKFECQYNATTGHKFTMNVADSTGTTTIPTVSTTQKETTINAIPTGGGAPAAVAIFNRDTIILGGTTGTQTGNNIIYNRVHGQWQYIATITPAAADTAYAVPFQGTNAVTDFANIASTASTSRIIFGAAGMYKLQFSAQVENTDNAQDHEITFWWRKNGVDVPNSAGHVTIPRAAVAAGASIVGWDNMAQSANATDYYELMYAVSDTAVTMPFIAAAAPRPGAAAVFLTLIPIGA